MTETRMTYSTFDKGGSLLFMGVIPYVNLILTNRSITLTNLYVAPNSKAGYPLLLGQDFIEEGQVGLF